MKKYNKDYYTYLVNSQLIENENNFGDNYTYIVIDEDGVAHYYSDYEPQPIEYDHDYEAAVISQINQSSYISAN